MISRICDSINTYIYAFSYPQLVFAFCSMFSFDSQIDLLIIGHCLEWKKIKRPKFITYCIIPNRRDPRYWDTFDLLNDSSTHLQVILLGVFDLILFALYFLFFIFVLNQLSPKNNVLPFLLTDISVYSFVVIRWIVLKMIAKKLMEKRKKHNRVD